MGARGPKRKPGALHLANGNPSKLSASDLKDSVQAPIETPDCPPHLLPDAKREWKRICPLLEELGLIAQIDMAVVAIYCQAYGRWKQAERKIAELNKSDPAGEAGLIGTTPSGYKQMSVWLMISNKAVEQMHRCFAEIGLSPSARTRVTPSDLQLVLPGFETTPPKDGVERTTGKVIGFPGL